MEVDEILIGNHRIHYPVRALLAAGIAPTGAFADSLVDFPAFPVPLRACGSNPCAAAGHPVPACACARLAQELSRFANEPRR
jgi:hypothetical protein